MFDKANILKESVSHINKKSMGQTVSATRKISGNGGRMPSMADRQ